MAELAELHIKITSGDVGKAERQLVLLGETSSKVENRIESLEYVMGALNRNMLDASGTTNKLLAALVAQGNAAKQTAASTTQAARASEVLEVQTKQTAAATNRLQGHFSSITSQIGRNIAVLIGTAGIVYALRRYTSAVIDAARGNQQINNSLTFATGSAVEAGREMTFLTGIARTYGQELQMLATNYGKFAAAARGTAMEGQGTRDVIEGLSAASATLALNSEQVEGALRAMEQMMSKGTVQAEELRGQLGERITGAFQMAARAMGVTTQELDKMLERGEVVSSKFLPAFARELQKTFGDDIAQKTDTLTGSINRLNTELFLMFTDERNQLANSLKDTIKEITEIIKDPDFQSAVTSFSNFLGFLSTTGMRAFADTMNAPGNLATILEGQAVEELTNALMTETDPAKRKELERIRQMYMDRISARANPNPMQDDGRSDGGRISAPVGLDPLAPPLSESQRGSIRKRASGMFDDPEWRLKQLKDQYEEERRFLKENQVLIFDSEAEFQERLYQLQLDYNERKKALEWDAEKENGKTLAARISNAAGYFEELNLLSQGSSAELFAVQKAFAIADATIKGIQAIQGAWASAPFPYNLPAVAMTTLSTGVNLAAIQSQQFAGNFASGGIVGGSSYAGDRQTANVNSGEMILNMQQQRELLNRANGAGGKGGGISVTINNNAPDTQVTTQEDQSGNLLVQITKRAVREAVGAVASDIALGDGPVSRSLAGPFAMRSRR